MISSVWLSPPAARLGCKPLYHLIIWLPAVGTPEALYGFMACQNFGVTSSIWAFRLGEQNGMFLVLCCRTSFSSYCTFKVLQSNCVMVSLSHFCMLYNKCCSISNTHPNVTLRQHYGKAALAAWDHKKALCVAVCFTHTQHSRRTRQHSSHTNIYPSLSLRCPCYCLGRHRKEPLYLSVCLCVCLCTRLPYPSMRACYLCFAKSPRLSFLQEHCL